MSTSPDQNVKGKTIVIDSSSSDSESESTHVDIKKGDKGKGVVLDSGYSDSESIVLRDKGKIIVKESSSSKSDDSRGSNAKRGSGFINEDVDDDSHQVPSIRRKICGCCSSRPCLNCCPNHPLGNSGPSLSLHQRLNTTAPRPPTVALRTLQSNQRIDFHSNVPEPRSVLNTPRINYGIQTQRPPYLQTISVAQEATVSRRILDVPAPWLASIPGARFTIGPSMNHAPVVLPPQPPLIHSDNIHLFPEYYDQSPPLSYTGNIYISADYYEPVQLRPVNPIALSLHRRTPRHFRGAFRPIAAQPNLSSLQPPPHLQNLRAVQMLQNDLNHEIAIMSDIDNMPYEDLIRLGELIGDVPTGLSEQRIYELMRRSSYSVSSRGGSFELKEFVVCLESFNAGDDVGILNCQHKFHTACIVPWLKMKNSCPICKAKALVSPNE